MAVLRAIHGPNAGQTYPLTGESIVLGRHPECNIVLDAGAVSRQHARIVKEGDDYCVEDMHSRNGTYLNGERVEGRAKLAEGDELKICDLVFAFHVGVPGAGVPPRELEPSRQAVLMVDDAKLGVTSTIASKLDISAGSTGLRVSVNPEAKLRALLEIGRNLGGAVRLGEVLPKLLDNLFAVFIQADRGFIVLKDRASGRLIPKAVKHRREGATEAIRISRTILQQAVSGKEAILSADAATDERFEMSESIVDFHIHSMMCAPLVGSDGEVLGVIQVDTRDQRRRFGRDDLEVLASVACQAAVAVENAQLHEIAMHEEVMRRELALAHKVQQGLLPATPPQLEGYEFFDFYEPAQQLGGDYFDYIPLQDGTLAAALADVSGKGIAAALLMARLSAEVRYCLASFADPAAAMERLNAVFCESRWEDRFVTMVLAVLDPLRHEVSIVNAGHLAPLVRHASGEVEAVGQQISGLPLGVEGQCRYEPLRVPLAPGDSLVLYTDGLPDAVNPEGQWYGSDRIRAQLEREAGCAAALCQRLLGDIRRFVGNRPQSDDMCLTCVRRKLGPEST
jgi:serine phosphatase RsbU (regulator of sigma subunit)/pSer/pThr/pTyr-binding forkhead associated (FHA) protein